MKVFRIPGLPLLLELRLRFCLKKAGLASSSSLTS